MNQKQKIILLMGITTFMAMWIWPPWVFRTSIDGSKFEQDLGYECLWTPPKYSWSKLKFPELPPDVQGEDIIVYEVKASLDTPRLYVQWVIAAAVTGGLILIFEDKRLKDEQTNK